MRILSSYNSADTHKTPRAMLLSLIALCAAPTPPQSAFTPPATQQALPATQPAISASLAAAEAQDGDQTIADAAVQAPAEPTPPPPASADGTVSNATLGAGTGRRCGGRPSSAQQRRHQRGGATGTGAAERGGWRR